ncbi:MAG TPA: benzoyl-CoA 2,3-epoxidase subunit BoxB, partial [Myxococcaceae bacterium]|nr:benzoyl-CoA 2,3-epoxidase subunit BoxB [Myxococcaceae bacterium]
EKFEDHLALGGVYGMELPAESGALRHEEVPLRNAMNEVLRDAYVEDCQRGVDRWNKVLAEAGHTERLKLPSRRFHRHQGVFAGKFFTPEGKPISEDEWNRRQDEWLPSASDREYVKSLMARPVIRPGEMANWIAPPPRGIDAKPLDFQYVRTDA